MKVFFLDLWHDLRAKRLWPVAAGLVVAVIAVPVLLLNGGSSDSGDATAPTPVTAQTGQPGAVVTPADQANPSSDLESFDSKDPFAGADKKKDADKAAVGAGSTPSGGTAENVTGGGAGQQGASGGSGSGTTTDTGSGTGGGETKSGADGKDTSSEQKSTPVTPYSYTLDIDFGRAGKTHLRRDVTPLTLLPDKNRPLLVFMGITASRKTAMFKVEGAVAEVEGEGICLPSRKKCNFVYLRSDQDHNVEFLKDSVGRKYTLKLLDINRVAVSELSAKSSSSKRDRARGATELFFGER